MATADGEGVVSHAGSRLLADVADRTTLTARLAESLAGLRKPRARHDPGRVLVDMAVAVADGATTISDVAVLADHAELFGAAASDSTCWRLLDHLDAPRLGAVAQARAAAREVVWAQRAELTGRPFPPAKAAGPGAARAGDRPRRVDRGLSQREGAGGTDVQEDVWISPDAGVLRQHRLHARVPRPRPRSPHGGGELRVLCRLGDHRQGTSRDQRHTRERLADAIDADGGHRDGAALAEITGVLPGRSLAGYPAGTRVIVRRERPHPGAQLDAFEERDGNTAWLAVVMLVVDLIAWTQHLLLHGELARAEPKTLRYRLMHVAGPALPRTAPALTTHPTLLALGPRPGRRVRPARRAARSRWLIFHPDTTSGGSQRQKQHAGGIAMPTVRSCPTKTNLLDHKISPRLRESPGLEAPTSAWCLGQLFDHGQLLRHAVCELGACRHVELAERFA
jgi:hypothetical protein